MNGSGDYLTGDINGIPNKASQQPPPGRQCTHCHRRCGNVAGGYAQFQGRPVCSRPTEPDRPDCYREIYYRFHPLTDCPKCMVTS